MEKNTENEFYNKAIGEFVRDYFALKTRRKLVILQNGKPEHLEMVEKELIGRANKLEEKVIVIEPNGLQNYQKKDSELVIVKYPEGVLELKGGLKDEAYLLDFKGFVEYYSCKTRPKSYGSHQHALVQGSQPSASHPYQQKKPY